MQAASGVVVEALFDGSCICKLETQVSEELFRILNTVTFSASQASELWSPSFLQLRIKCDTEHFAARETSLVCLRFQPGCIDTVCMFAGLSFCLIQSV